MKIFYIIIILTLGNMTLDAQMDFDKEQIKKITLKKTRDLGHYITTIGDKEVEREFRVEAVRSAVNLFMSDKNIVQVSSLNGPTREYTIRKYLNRLMVLKYAKVEITWYDINIISDFKQGPDGDYYATVRIYQKFTGYDSEGKMVYTDVTTKDISVKLTRIKIPTDEGYEDQIQVLLGDIKVVETK